MFLLLEEEEDFNKWIIMDVAMEACVTPVTPPSLREQRDIAPSARFNLPVLAQSCCVFTPIAAAASSSDLTAFCVVRIEIDCMSSGMLPQSILFSVVLFY